MKILVTTPILRTKERTFFYPRAMQSIYDQQWNWQIDHFSGNGEGATPFGDIASKFQQARVVLLRGGYDALLCAESDMILPPNALKLLAALNADVAYGLYVLRMGRHPLNAYLSVADNRRGESLSAYPERVKANWGNPIEVAGVGTGCVLIRRYVLEALDFRSRTHQYPDWCFAVDAQYAGATQVCHMGVLCGHQDGMKILWPDVNMQGFCRIEYL
jgi:hypothetical protein